LRFKRCWDVEILEENFLRPAKEKLACPTEAESEGGKSSNPKGSLLRAKSVRIFSNAHRQYLNMAHNNIEIEIQVNVENLKPLIRFLKSNAIFQAKKHQVDEYFSPIHKDFLSNRPVSEWLRLRNAGNQYSINYKNWHHEKDSKSCYCDELETGIENIGQVRKILTALNFKSIATIDKLRKIYIYKDYEVAIDSVKDLGDFVEIEYIGKDKKADPEKITAGMINFLKKIGCGKIKRNYGGYPYLLLFPKEVKYDVS